MDTQNNLATIAITQDNLGHFNKRLQKALNNSLGIDVKLTQAADIFAQACGKSSTYEIQKILKANTPDGNKDVSSFSLIKFKQIHVKEIIKKFTEVIYANFVFSEFCQEIIAYKVASQIFFKITYKEDGSLFQLKIPFLRQEDFSTYLNKQLSGQKIHILTEIALDKLFKSFWSKENDEDYDNFLIETICQHIFNSTNNVEWNLLGASAFTLYRKKGYNPNHFLIKDNGFFKPLILVALDDIYTHSHTRPIVFKSIEQAFKFINKSCYERDLPSFSFTIKFHSQTHNTKDFQQHYVFNKKDNTYLATKDGKEILLNDLKKIYKEAINKFE